MIHNYTPPQAFCLLPAGSGLFRGGLTGRPIGQKPCLLFLSCLRGCGQHDRSRIERWQPGRSPLWSQGSAWPGNRRGQLASLTWAFMPSWEPACTTLLPVFPLFPVPPSFSAFCSKLACSLWLSSTLLLPFPPPHPQYINPPPSSTLTAPPPFLLSRE